MAETELKKSLERSPNCAMLSPNVNVLKTCRIVIVAVITTTTSLSSPSVSYPCYHPRRHHHFPRLKKKTHALLRPRHCNGGVYRSRPGVEVTASAALQEVVCSVHTSAGECWLGFFLTSLRRKMRMPHSRQTKLFRIKTEANQSGQSQTFSTSTIIAVLERMYRWHHEEGVSSKLCSLHVSRIRRLSRSVGELAASSYQQDLCPSSCPCMNTPETTAPWLALEIYAMGIRSTSAPKAAQIWGRGGLRHDPAEQPRGLEAVRSPLCSIEFETMLPSVLSCRPQGFRGLQG